VLCGYRFFLRCKIKAFNRRDRGGIPEIAEKSRTIAEKSTDLIEGNGIESRYKTDRRAHARHAQDLPERLYRRRLVVLDFEDGVQLGDLQQVVHFLGQFEQFEFTALVFGGGICADQFADP
jgi:hypothetical protein